MKGEMDRLRESISKTEGIGLWSYPPKHKEHENIKKAILYLQSLDDGSRLLDVEGFIQDTHQILMEGIRKDGGQFSVCLRTASFRGEEIIYPAFADQNLTYAALLFIVDLYNATKNSVKFLFTFLYIHPFGDGNGRLGKLLLSYCSGWEKTFFPPQEQYLIALMSAQKKLPEFGFIDTETKALEMVYTIWNADTLKLEELLQ